jgi:hypothetical protein
MVGGVTFCYKEFDWLREVVAGNTVITDLLQSA